MQSATVRIETALTNAIERATGGDAPPRLSAALRHSVFPGGARIRPRLCLAVADACGRHDASLVDAAAAAVELLHCASLVHDDLPCFDDAATRRGVPSVHAAHGAPLAVLAGDALIVLAFAEVARIADRDPMRAVHLIKAICEGVGAPNGIVAGQAFECEPQADLSAYHRAKTGALFVASASAGAIVAGGDPKLWHRFASRLGEAYQVADDIRDLAALSGDTGKPVGQDAAHDRPNAVGALGLKGSLQRLNVLVDDALCSVPDCPGAATIRAIVTEQARRFLPSELRQAAAAA